MLLLTVAIVFYMFATATVSIKFTFEYFHFVIEDCTVCWMLIIIDDFYLKYG